MNRYILCSGMPRSASTWSYNVCKDIVRAKGTLDLELPGYVGMGTSGQDVDQFIASRVIGNPRDVVLKFHFAGPRTLALCWDSRVRNVFTHRDPRDAIASHIRAFGAPFEASLDWLEKVQHYIQEYRNSRNTLFVSYVEIIGASFETVRKINGFIGYDVSDNEAFVISINNNTENTKKKLDNMNFVREHGHDRESLLHKTHFTHGGVGYWSEILTAAQVKTIERKLAMLFEEFDYQAS